MDRGQKETDKILKEVEKRINKEYAQAEKEIESKLNDYLRRFEIKDKKWQEWVESGKKTQAEYDRWRIGQMAVGERWSDQKDMIARELANVNNTAKALTKASAADVYAQNHNYATYEVEKGAKINTGYNLYSKESVAKLMTEDPDVLPAPGKKISQAIAEGKAIKWDRQKLQSVMMQGILQGDSIPNLATRLAESVGESDRKAAIRNARTMATRAQNAGRVDAHKRAEEMGVEMLNMWLATFDNRTRTSHRHLDHQTVPVGEDFENGLEYPGDPKGDDEEVYNCRCSLRGVVKGLEPRAYKYRDTAVVGMSYDEWLDAKPKSQDILHQEKVGEAMRRKHIREYMGHGGDVVPTQSNQNSTNNTENSGIIYVESEAHKKLMMNINGLDKPIEYNPVKPLTSQLTEAEIIERISGGDMTKGSCSSLTYAYIGNKHGLDVRDFRGGKSQDFFSQTRNANLINELDGVKNQTFYLQKEASDLAKKLKELDLEKGKEYRLACGRHAAIIRNTDNGYEYLELQSNEKSGWRSFTKKTSYKVERGEDGIKLVPDEKDCTMSEKLYERFGCRKTKSDRPILGDDGKLLLDKDGKMVFGERVDLTEVDSFKGNKDFEDILGYINTDESKQKKGASGGEK